MRSAQPGQLEADRCWISTPLIDASATKAAPRIMWNVIPAQAMSTMDPDARHMTAAAAFESATSAAA